MTVPPTFQFRIPIDVGAMSPNRRLHWTARYKPAAKARLEAFEVWAAAGRPKAVRRVTLDFEVFRGRRMDDDNLIAALKPVRDGLCGGALTPDDSPAWVRQGKVTQRTGRCFAARPEVVVTATEDPA